MEAPLSPSVAPSAALVPALTLPSHRSYTKEDLAAFSVHPAESTVTDLPQLVTERPFPPAWLEDVTRALFGRTLNGDDESRIEVLGKVQTIGDGNVKEQNPVAVVIREHLCTNATRSCSLEPNGSLNDLNVVLSRRCESAAAAYQEKQLESVDALALTLGSIPQPYSLQDVVAEHSFLQKLVRGNGDMFLVEGSKKRDEVLAQIDYIHSKSGIGPLAPDDIPSAATSSL
ncbi:hypothetical protein DFH29DRAFT_1010540 [Suillus ampliporus]|nr:hypothetical protein DFH29DRAFT_1010540 [Suillus ampliporus]